MGVRKSLAMDIYIYTRDRHNPMNQEEGEQTTFSLLFDLLFVVKNSMYSYYSYCQLGYSLVYFEHQLLVEYRAPCI